jgi:hypothetical protein
VPDSRRHATAFLLPLFFLGLLLLHLPLLRLPYFWDEAGYYIPAARDLLLTGAVIPHSAPSNAHPPLVMAYLALAWKFLGFAPVVTRAVMLLVAAFALLGVFRLAQRVANAQVAIASAVCTAVYPVFFVQSSLAQIDLAAAGLTFWGVLAYVERRRWMTAVWFSLAALAKETAILAPLALFAWELISGLRKKPQAHERRWSLLVPLFPLACWYAFHYLRTGFVFGNPEFFRYNVTATLNPLRIVLALGLRLWQTAGYMNLCVLTLIALLAMWLQPLSDNGQERKRIAIEIQFEFAAIIAAYVLTLSVVGGAVLARYMLPVIPLVIILCVSTLRRRMRLWRAAVVIVALAFAAALFVSPPYGFSLEDNLAYRDYIVLHQRAENLIQSHYPAACVLTAWPASDELSRPYLGYRTRAVRVFRIENFNVEQLLAAADFRSDFDLALVFSTKYQPPNLWIERWRTWQRWKTEFFGFYRDVPPEAAAQILGGKLIYREGRKGQWVGVIEMQQAEEARETVPYSGRQIPTLNRKERDLGWGTQLCFIPH